MNHYTELLYYIKSLAEADDLINTVTKGDFDKVDIEKGTLFPLVHINISGGRFSNGQTVLFNVQVGCFDIRDINKTVNADTFWGNDNAVDNLNETLAVLNRMWLKMYTDFEDRDITASENPTLEIFEDSRGNILDGWILTFDVEMPNTTISLCP